MGVALICPLCMHALWNFQISMRNSNWFLVLFSSKLQNVGIRFLVSDLSCSNRSGNFLMVSTHPVSIIHIAVNDSPISNHYLLTLVAFMYSLFQFSFMLYVFYSELPCYHFVSLLHCANQQNLQKCFTYLTLRCLMHATNWMSPR